MTVGAKPPPRPARLRSQWVDSGRECSLRYRPRSLGSSCFLVLWLIGWTVGCVFLIGLVLYIASFFVGSRDPEETVEVAG